MSSTAHGVRIRILITFKSTCKERAKEISKTAHKLFNQVEVDPTRTSIIGLSMKVLVDKRNRNASR